MTHDEAASCRNRGVASATCPARSARTMTPSVPMIGRSSRRPHVRALRSSATSGIPSGLNASQMACASPASRLGQAPKSGACGPLAIEPRATAGAGVSSSRSRRRRPDEGRCPFGSGGRTSQRGSPGPPSPPSPLSHGDGRGGATDLGEGQALPRTPGLPLRGRFPMDTSPCQHGRGRRGVRAVPAGPAARRRCRFPTATFPCQMAGGKGGPIRGRAKPSPASPGRRRAAASQSPPCQPPTARPGERPPRYPATNRLVSFPRPSTSTVTSSPGFSHRFSGRPMITPAGVPVTITSPGSSGKMRLA